MEASDLLRVAVVAALRVLLEHDLVEVLALARILVALLGALRARPVRLREQQRRAAQKKA